MPYASNVLVLYAVATGAWSSLTYGSLPHVVYGIVTGRRCDCDSVANLLADKGYK